MQAKVSTIIYIWLVKWVIESDHEVESDNELTGDESWDIYQWFKIVNFICAGVLIPLFGKFSDKFAVGHELMAVFGLRCIGCMSFFLLDNPKGNIVIFTFIAISLSASLQQVVVESLFSKRLPGDVRASMLSVKGVAGNLGHLTFVCFSLAMVDYFNDINRSMVFVSLFDATMFFSVSILIIFAGFDNDFHSGNQAKLKGKEQDAKEEVEMKKQVDEAAEKKKLQPKSA